jgi:hypothetical protein
MNSEIILYQTNDGQTKIEVVLDNETVWLTLNQMAELFQRDKSVISRHIKSIFETKELDESSTVAKNATVQVEGDREIQRDLEYYNLDIIISVGYRVKSHRGTQFRIWATQRLKEYIVKGFVLDDERLKSAGQMNYFDELLNRVRDIRSSEKVFYQKVKDIYTISIDYDKDSELSHVFFATVQNKLHWAVHHHTAAELIYERAKSDSVNMGLTVWKGEKIRKSDIIVAKNYLKKEEIELLNLLVEQYLAFAEAQAQAKRTMYMKDWIKKLNDILTINEREILEHAGRISKQLAEELAEKEYEKFKKQQQTIEKEQSFKELESDIKSLRSKK